jgi:alkylation response protein AidB-like acyl-CoA dehydrogenase
MFELSRSQKEIQKAAREFAKGEFDKELTVEYEKERTFPSKIWEKAADLGFIGIQFPEEFSGGGMGLFEACLIAEELCRKDSTMGSALMLSALGAECLHRFGSDAMKAAYLPKVAEGEILAGAAFSETARGDDFGTLDTTAVRDGDEWVINGVKNYVVNGGNAGFYVVLCRTSSELDGDKGASLILVEGDRGGLSAESMGDKLALNMMATSQLTFRDVRVPVGNLIGKEGQGISHVKTFFDEVRLVSAARALGTAAGAFDRALLYVKQREQFNRKLAQFQVTRHKIADMATKVALARGLTYQTAWAFDQGKADSAQVSMAKMAAARLALEVTDEAIQLFGGYGYMTEQEVERFYRDAKLTELTMGTPDVQKDNIAAAVIGKIK